LTIKAGTPAVSMDELKPAMSVMTLTRLMSTQRRQDGQFIGFSGYDESSHDTMLASSAPSACIDGVLWADSG